MEKKLAKEGQAKVEVWVGVAGMRREVWEVRDEKVGK